MSQSQPELTMVLVTRRDLKLSAGKLAAQCGHAAVECALKARRNVPRQLERWRDEGARKIVLRCEDIDSLRRLFGEAMDADLPCYMVKDAGHTEIPAGTVTVVGIGPGPRREIDALTGDLPLVN